MDELLPPEVPLSPDPPPIPAAIPSSSAAPPPSPPLPPPTEITLPPSVPVASTGAPALATKRQRRPSVRLGEIGDQSCDLSQPRRPKTWRFHKHPAAVAKTSKTRPLTNLVNGNGGGISYHHDYDGSYEFGARKSKSKRPTKRAKSNSSWTSAAAIKFDADENVDDDEFRERDEAAEEEEEEEEEDGSQSPVHSMGIEFWDRRAMRGNVDTPANGAIHNETNADDENMGVRDWLIGLGLGRYAPVFEVHEVDDQVLPMLTLDDLKDMGINAVGSRRKIYSAIQKLRQGFS